MIQNPTPIQTNVFNGYWITSVQFIVDTKLVQASLLPYDGQHLLATNRRTVNISENTQTLINAVILEIKRLSGKTVDVKFIRVIAPEPSKPIILHVTFSDNTTHIVQDCLALAGNDNTFAAVFNSALANIASLAGLTIS